MKNDLIKLGFSEHEVAVYLAILSLGQANVLDIARKAQISRASVYEILEKLMAERMVSSLIKGKRRYYLAEDPGVIMGKMRQNEKIAAKLLPNLKALYLSATNKPVIRTYEGAQGIIALFHDILATVPKGGQYDAILNSRDEFAIIGKEFDRYISDRIKKRIFAQVITEHSELTKGWEGKENMRKMLRRVKFLPRGEHFSVSYHIYGNKVSMFSLQGPVVGVIIENKEIAEMERLQFEYMWKGLK